jgi:diadenylate cyclase
MIAAIISESCFQLSKNKIGAIIVFEINDSLKKFCRTGIVLDAAISSPLLISLFQKESPLHDGAVIIKNDRIVSASVFFPLNKKLNIDKSYGSRHRAALTMSNMYDCLLIVVSETNKNVIIFSKSKFLIINNQEELVDIIYQYLMNKIN